MGHALSDLADFEEVIQEFSNAAAAINTRLAEIKTSIMRHKLGMELTDEDLVRRAQYIYDRHKFRRKIFNCVVFSEPSWDMMLELFLCHMRNVKIGVTSLVLASGAAATTGLRLVDVLTDKGLVQRVPSAHDRRVTYVCISHKGLELMKLYLRSDGIFAVI